MPNQHPWYKHSISEVLPLYNNYYNQLEVTNNKFKRFNIINNIAGFLSGTVVIENTKNLMYYLRKAKKEAALELIKLINSNAALLLFWNKNNNYC